MKILIAHPIPGTRGTPLPIWRICKTQNGAPDRGLLRLRLDLDQRRKRAGPILSGSSLAITATWGAFSLRAEPEMFRRTFAPIAALNARAFCL
jgi:hypothetical protein